MFHAGRCIVRMRMDDEPSPRVDPAILQEERPMSVETKAVARRFFAESASGAADAALIAPDLIYHGPPMIGELRGRDAFVQVLDLFRRAFPGFTTTIEELVAEGDLVAVRHTHHGVHRGEFNGIPPAGREIHVTGIEIVRVRDGQVAEFWHLDDFLTLLQQLGALPAPASA
jgi:steroid delta-isomerase-like uncharacterized protein